MLIRSWPEASTIVTSVEPAPIRYFVYLCQHPESLHSVDLESIPWIDIHVSRYGRGRDKKIHLRKEEETTRHIEYHKNERGCAVGKCVDLYPPKTSGHAGA